MTANFGFAVPARVRQVDLSSLVTPDNAGDDPPGATKAHAR